MKFALRDDDTSFFTEPGKLEAVYGDVWDRVPVLLAVVPHAAVSAAGLNLLGSFLSFRPSMRPWDARTSVNWWRVRQFRSRTNRVRHDRFVYPHVLRYWRHAEFGCHSLVPGTTAEQLIAGFEEARREGGHFCLATHYWEVNATLKDVLLRVLDHAARYPDVEFVSAEQLFA